MRIRGLLALAACVAVAAAPAAFSAAAGQLAGTVGPGFTISLADGSGASVSRLDPGTYELTVRDLSIDHNFHLQGPGVDRFTQVEDTGTETWAVTLQAGRYTILCDPHASTMFRQLTVGTPQTTPPPAAVPRLVAAIGPGTAISLRTAAGALVKTLRAGTYSISVRDRSRLHNFHLVGKGVNRRTALAGTGTTTWKLKLAAGPLRFFSDRSPKTVRGSAVVR